MRGRRGGGGYSHHAWHRLNIINPVTFLQYQDGACQGFNDQADIAITGWVFASKIAVAHGHERDHASHERGRVDSNTASWEYIIYIASVST